MRRWGRRSPGTFVLGLLLAGGASAQNPVATPANSRTEGSPANPAAQNVPSTPASVPGAGQISGLVVDAGADVVDDADVTLTRDGTSDVRKIKTDDDGRYRFTNVPPGKFTVTATDRGMTPGSYSGLLHAGEDFGVPTLKLGTAAVGASVDVVASQVDLAEAEVHVEEHQRLAGFMPNFFVTYDWHAAPLDAKQKLELSWRNTIDPANFAISAITAGVQQARNQFPGYGQGAAGYGKRLGADTGDLLFGTFMGGFVFPAVLHQDPRYFYKGTGSVISRALYALSAAVICRGDNGKWQPNYSGVLGDFSAGALSNLYYPASDRNGASLTLENGLLDIGEDAIGNLVQEFVFKHITPHAATYGPGSPGAATP
jgi:hypothetical protein